MLFVFSQRKLNYYYFVFCFLRLRQPCGNVSTSENEKCRDERLLLIHVLWLSFALCAKTNSLARKLHFIQLRRCNRFVIVILETDHKCLVRGSWNVFNAEWARAFEWNNSGHSYSFRSFDDVRATVQQIALFLHCAYAYIRNGIARTLHII